MNFEKYLNRKKFRLFERSKIEEKKVRVNLYNFYADKKLHIRLLRVCNSRQNYDKRINERRTLCSLLFIIKKK